MEGKDTDASIRGSKWNPVTEFCEHVYEFSVYITVVKFTEKINYYGLLKKDYNPWS
jgi:hypothetical protein